MQVLNPVKSTKVIPTTKPNPNGKGISTPNSQVPITTVKPTTGTVTTKPTTGTITPAVNPNINVYATGTDLQTAKNTYGANKGYTYIDTGISGYKAPTTYGANDLIVVNGKITKGNASPTPLTGDDYMAKLEKAYADAQANAPAIPTYDSTANLNAINSNAIAQESAVKTRNDELVRQGTADLNKTYTDAQPQYIKDLNQVDVNNFQTQRVLDQRMADQGMWRSGENLTQQAILGASRNNQLGALTVANNKLRSDLDLKIADLKAKGESDTSAQIFDLESQKQQAIINENDRAFSHNLEIYSAKANKTQSDLNNMIQGMQFAYGVSKDQASAIFDQQKFDYQKAQDIADANSKQNELNYQHTLDSIKLGQEQRKINDAEATASFNKAVASQRLAITKAVSLSTIAKNNAAKNGVTLKTTQSDIENRTWLQFYNSMDTGTEDQWIKKNRKSILTTVGANGNKLYTSMTGIVNRKGGVKARQDAQKATKDAIAKRKADNQKATVDYIIGNHLGLPTLPGTFNLWNQ